MNLLLKSSLSGSQLDEVVRVGLEALGHRVNGALRWQIIAQPADGPMGAGPGIPSVEFTVESVPQPPKLQIGGTRTERCGQCGGSGRQRYHCPSNHDDMERACPKCNGKGTVTVTLRGSE